MNRKRVKVGHFWNNKNSQFSIYSKFSFASEFGKSVVRLSIFIILFFKDLKKIYAWVLTENITKQKGKEKCPKRK